MRDGSEVLHRLDVGEETVTFSDRGEGEPVLLVHAGALAAWFPALADEQAMSGFRLVTPVRAGYDSTAPAPGRHLTIADHAAHCAAVLDSLQIRRTHVLGHSSGSLIGLQLATARPDLVHSLVLIEPAPAATLLPPPVVEGVRAALQPLVDAASAGDLIDTFDVFMRDFCARDYREVLLARLGPDGVRQAERDCGFFFRDEILACQEWSFDQASASSVDQPVLLIRGAGNDLAEAINIGLAGMLADAEDVVLDGADHLLPLRDPATVARLATDFAGRHRMAAAV